MPTAVPEGDQLVEQIPGGLAREARKIRVLRTLARGAVTRSAGAHPFGHGIGGGFAGLGAYRAKSRDQKGGDGRHAADLVQCCPPLRECTRNVTWSEMVPTIAANKKLPIRCIAVTEVIASVTCPSESRFSTPANPLISRS